MGMQASNDAKIFLAENEYENDHWDRWFGKVIDLINRHDESMWCYINCDWESQPMWHDVGFGETRLISNANVMSQWHEKVIGGKGAHRTFLGSGSLENCGVDYDMDIEATNNTTGAFGLTPFYSFILVPFLVASGAFFVPYFILGGHKARHRHSSKSEQRTLLSGMDESVG